MPTIFKAPYETLNAWFEAKGFTVGGTRQRALDYFRSISPLSAGSLTDHINRVLGDQGFTGTVNDKLTMFFGQQVGTWTRGDSDRLFFEDTSKIFGGNRFSLSGLTFDKDYKDNQSSLDADESEGTATATFTASRSASNPATTIETQDGNALLFDGVDDEVDCGVIGLADADQTIWIKLRKAPIAATEYVVSSRDGGEGGLTLSIASDGKMESWIGTTSQSTKSTSTVDDNIYHDIAIVYNKTAGTITYYIDGVSDGVDSSLSGTFTANANTTIGDREASSSNLEGAIKDVKIFNVALDSNDIAGLSNGTIPSGLNNHWDFSDATGSTLTDIVGSNDGTITGAKWLTDGSTYLTKITADDTARWTQGYYNSTGFNAAPGLLYEGASTNLIKMGIFATDGGSGLSSNWTVSDDVTNALTTTLVEEALTNISNSKAQRLQQTFGDGTTVSIISDKTAAATFTQDETATVSVWLKGTLTGISSLKLTVKQYDSSDVAGTTLSGADIKASVSSTEWRRFEFSTITADADADRIEFQIVVLQPGSGSIDLNIAAAQAEQAAYPSSFIPTTSAALTRNAETLTYLTASNFAGGTDGTIALAYRPIMLPDEQAAANKTLFAVTIDADNRWLTLYSSNATDKVYFHTEDATVESTTEAETTAEPFGSSRYSLHSLVMGYSETADGSGKRLTQYIDGSLDGDDTAYTTPAGSLPTNIQIQSDPNQSMILVGLSLLNRRLSAAEAATVAVVMTS